MAKWTISQRLTSQRFGASLPLAGAGGLDSVSFAAIVFELEVDTGVDAAEGFGGDSSVPGARGASGSRGAGRLVSVLAAGAGWTLETGEGGGGGKSGIDVELPGMMSRDDEPGPMPEPGDGSSGKFSFGNSWLPKGGNVTLAGA